jgi:ADP-ribose pyrophosphatase
MLGDTNFVPEVKRELLVKGDKFDYERVSERWPGTPWRSRHLVRHPGAVIIAPLLDVGGHPGVVLIRNWRVSVGGWLWELPAGTLGPGEDPAIAAARELGEETGFQAATITPVTRFHTSPGLSDELMHAYTASGLSPGPQRLEPDEHVTVHPLPAYEAMSMIRLGQITDAKSILVLMWLFGSAHPPLEVHSARNQA